MSISKSRPHWDRMPAVARAAIGEVIGGRVVDAQSCAGGFSPGFASRLTLADGRRVFVKAMDADAWPGEAQMHRAEARVSGALPPSVPAPRLLGSLDDGHWVILAFEDIDGAEPRRPWNSTELDRVVAAAGRLAQTVTPSPIEVSRDHPRLGGWSRIAHDPVCLARLRSHSVWAAGNIERLVHLETEGLVAARGESLIHGDLYPHNVLLTAERVVFVDWPHARLGAPVVDLITLLISAAADRIDPEPILNSQAGETVHPAVVIDAVLAAHAGFLLRGGLSAPEPGLEAITEAKLRLGLGAMNWLQRRLRDRG